MSIQQYWLHYNGGYREQEVAQIGRWLDHGDSGMVLGLVGCGRSNLLSFICQRPDAIQPHLQSEPIVHLIQADIYNLPSYDLSNLYRTLLYAFSWNASRFADESLRHKIVAIYERCHDKTDPFVSQVGLSDLMHELQGHGIRVALVFNRFDRFCENASAQMLSSLRNLRDMFRGTLCYIAGTSRDLAYVQGASTLDDIYDLMVAHHLWVGALSPADAQAMIESHFPNSLPVAEAEMLCRLSGRFPSLLKAVCQWRQKQEVIKLSLGDLTTKLGKAKSVTFRLGRIWQGLTQEERHTLLELNQLQIEEGRPSDWQHAPPPAVRKHNRLVKEHKLTLDRLCDKGLIFQYRNCWEVGSELLGFYLMTIGASVTGRIRIIHERREVVVGKRVINDLTDLEFRILAFMDKNPKVILTSRSIIEHVWEDVSDTSYVEPNVLQVHISKLRKKLEPMPREPKHIITQRGSSGGYQYFPEGIPD